MITKEELIKRSDDVINQLENIIVDIKHDQGFFVDLDETMEDVGELDNLIGVWSIRKGFDLLFYRGPDFYTKTFLKK